MNKFHIEHTKFSKLLERMESFQYNLERNHKKVGLEGVSQFEEAIQKIEDFYELTISDLIHEANSHDPAHGCDTAWLNEVINDCKISMGEY